jgi:hypothetical protein
VQVVQAQQELLPILYLVVIPFLVRLHPLAEVAEVPILMVVHLLAQAVQVVVQDLAVTQLQVRELPTKVMQVVMEITQAIHFLAVAVVALAQLAQMLLLALAVMVAMVSQLQLVVHL